MAADNTNDRVFVHVIRWLQQQASNVLAAIQEHHRWIDSPRARALEEWSERISVLLLCGAYLAFGYLGYRLWVDVTPLAARISQVAPEVTADVLDVRSSLFHVFAGAFLIPAGLFVTWFVVKWTYRLLAVAANRRLPRFTRVLVYPVVLCCVALVMHGYRTPITTLLAHAYVQGRATVATARQPTLRVVEAEPPSSQQPTTLVNTRTTELIEELRKRNRNSNNQQPPEPLPD